jgi:hypothetical protein
VDALEGPLRWHATTGLTDEQLAELTQRAAAHLGGWQTGRGRPRAVPFAQAVVITLAILRHNLPQALIAELWGISQPTASRIYQALRRNELLLVDGCLLPVGERTGHRSTTAASGTPPGSTSR